MSILSLLNSGNFQMYNRAVARELGSVNAAIFLSEMINRYEFHQQEKTLFVEDGVEWFYYTNELGTERLCLSKKEQDTAVKILIERGFVEKCVKGLPAKRYFSLNNENIEAYFLNSKSISRSDEKAQLEVTKGSNQKCPKGAAIYRYKNSREELKEEKRGEGAAAPGAKAPRSPSSLKIERRKYVHVPKEEHEKLQKEHGPEKTEKFYDTLQEWKEDTPKAKWKKSDYKAIRRWVIDAVHEDELKEKKRRESGIGVEDERKKFFDENKKKAEKFLQDKEFPDRNNRIIIYEDRIFIKKLKGSHSIGYADANFMRKLENEYEAMIGRKTTL